MLNKLVFSNKRFLLSKLASKLFSAQQPKESQSVLDLIKTNTNNLNNIISESFKKETDNYYPVDENQLKSILNARGFSFINQESSKIFILEKKSENQTIRAIITPQQPDYSQSQAEKEETRITSFFITIKSDKGKSGLLIDAVAVSDKIEITQVNHSSEIDALESKTFNLKKVDENTNALLKVEYSGPHFYTLDIKLKKSFSDMLNHLGFDDQIASVISVLAIEKDQELYLNWLKNLNKFI